MQEIKIIAETLPWAAVSVMHLNYVDKQVLAIDDNGEDIIELEISSKNNVYIPEFSLDSEFKVERLKYEIDKYDMNCQIIQRCEALASLYTKINSDIIPAIYIYIRSDTIFVKSENSYGSNLKLAIMITEDQDLDIQELSCGVFYYGLCCYIPNKLFL